MTMRVDLIAGWHYLWATRPIQPRFSVAPWFFVFSVVYAY
jgi:hypothetical protein